MLSNIADIKKRRVELNVTQAALAGVAGLHQSAITRIESEKLDCRMSTLKLLSESLEIIYNNRNYKYTGAIILSKTAFQNTVYRSMIEELERLEHEGQFQGNGHHLAQRIGEMIYKECFVNGGLHE